MLVKDNSNCSFGEDISDVVSCSNVVNLENSIGNCLTNKEVTNVDMFASLMANWISG